MEKEEAIKLADEILKKDPLNFTLRSCWDCNRAHEYLKDCPIPLKCFLCGKCYFKGVDITEYQNE